MAILFANPKIFSNFALGNIQVAMMNERKTNLDMLHGPIAVKMVLLAIPIFISASLQQLFNATDIAVVGRFCGGNALASVGANTFIINLLVNIFIGLSIGSNVVIARLIGKGDKDSISKAVHTSLSLAMICGVMLVSVGWFIARPVLELLDTPTDILDDAVTYFHIYFFGTPFFLVFNYGSAILRSKGDTRRPLYILAVSGVVNIILNLFFVICCGMRVAGVAWATVISAFISASVLLWILTHEKDALRVDLHNLGIDWPSLKEIISVGLPAGIQGAIFSFSNVVIQGAINSLGANAVASTTMALYGEYFSFYALMSIDQSAMSFLSQNYGAEDKVRCKRIVMTSIMLSIGCVATVSWLFILFRRGIVGIFCTDPAVIELASTRVLIVLCLYIFNGLNDLLSSLMRAVGHSMVPAVICVLGICGTRILWVSFVFPSHHSYEWICYCYPMSWIATFCVMMPVAFFTVRRTLRKL